MESGFVRVGGYGCAACSFVGRTYNELIEHGQLTHGDRVQDPGNEFSSPSKKKLLDVIAWVRKQPDANLKTGEGALLLDEIDRLAGDLIVAQTANIKLQEELHQCLHNWNIPSRDEPGR